jgi:hypothetical protein
MDRTTERVAAYAAALEFTSLPEKAVHNEE